MDQQILKKVYNKHIQSLFDYGIKLSGNKDLVIDEIHDLFLYIFEKRLDPNEIRNLKAYLITSLRRRIIKRLGIQRSMSPETEIPYDFNLDFSVESKIIEGELTAEMKNILDNAIHNLTARQKEIIHLKYFENFSNDEIQEAMNLTDQATRNLLSKTLRKLRESFPDTRILTLLLLS